MIRNNLRSYSRTIAIWKFILASSCSLWYHFEWVYESRQLCVSPYKYTATEFSVKTRLDGTQGWDV